MTLGLLLLLEGFCWCPRQDTMLGQQWTVGLGDGGSASQLRAEKHPGLRTHADGKEHNLQQTLIPADR